MVTLQAFQSKPQASFRQSFLPTPLQRRRSRIPGFRPPDSGVGSEVLSPGEDSGPAWSILAGPSSGFVPDMYPPSHSSIHLSHIHSLSRDSHAKHFIRTPNRQICPWPPRLPNLVHSWVFFSMVSRILPPPWPRWAGGWPWCCQFTLVAQQAR